MREFGDGGGIEARRRTVCKRVLNCNNGFAVMKLKRRSCRVDMKLREEGIGGSRFARKRGREMGDGGGGLDVIHRMREVGERRRRKKIGRAHV